jgi:hypothetical protein
MTTIHRGPRRVLAAAVAATAALSLAFAGTPTAQASDLRAAGQAKSTALTIAIRACEGCEVTLISYTDANPQDGWSSDAHVVQNGKAAFVVPTERTAGMSVMVHTPWEGQTGYATMMVFRYQGLVPGDRIGFNRARTMRKASGCWAGTNKKEVTLRFKVRRVNVPGVHGRVPGQIAWAPTTQVWLRPVLPVYGGVLGGQDVILCRVVGAPGAPGGS